MKNSRNLSRLGARVEELLESYQVGIMTLIRISNRLVVLGKSAEMVPPHHPVPTSAFHDFAQYIKINVAA